MHVQLRIAPAGRARARRAARSDSRPARSACRLHSAVTIASISSSSRRVCGGSSSSERPSTSCASRLASRDVVERDLDVLDRSGRRCWTVLTGPLVLVQAERWRGSASDTSCDRAACASVRPRKRQLVARRDSRPQTGFKSRCALRCSAGSRRARSCAQQPFERLRLALHRGGWPASARGLRSPSAPGSGSTAPRRSRCAVVVRKIITGPSTRYSCVSKLARRRVFAGRSDRQLAFRLATASAHRRPRCALLFDDGQHLVLEIGLAHVEERLPGHRGVLHALLLRHEGQHRIHQRTLARRR